MEIKTKAPKAGGREITVEFDFSTDLNTATEKFGAEMVHGLFVDQAVIKLQAALRGMMEDNKSDDEIKAFVATWKPGTRVAREAKPAQLTKESALALFGNLSPEEKAEFIRQLKAAATA